MFRDGPPGREEQERFNIEKWVRSMQEQIERLRELTPPKYDRRGSGGSLRASRGLS